jgi:transposase
MTSQSPPTGTAEPDAKRLALARHATLHPHPERVTDAGFNSDPFFDPRDATQVKYEMLRRVEVEGVAVTEATRAFGLSRPTFYEARAEFQSGGLAALLPKKKGPRRGHKLSAEVMAFLGQTLGAEPGLGSAELARRVQERFGVRVHPRSVVRALERGSGKA